MIYVFDMFGVVVNWGSDAVMPDWAKYCNTTEKKVRDSTSILFNLCESGKLSMPDFWADFGKQFKCDGKGLERLLEKRFSERASLNDGVVKIVSELKDAGYMVVLLSNQLPAHGEWCKEKGWFGLFDKVFLSYEIGYRKPSPEAYKKVAFLLKTPPSELVLIDDKKENVDAALEVGLKGVVYTNDIQLRMALNAYMPPHPAKTYGKAG